MILENYKNNEKYYLDIFSVRNNQFLLMETPVFKEIYLKFEELIYNIAKLFTPKNRYLFK